MNHLVQNLTETVAASDGCGPVLMTAAVQMTAVVVGNYHRVK